MTLQYTQPLPKSFDEAVANMLKCQQTETQTVYQHGQSVKEFLFDLLNHVRNNDLLEFDWKLPEWFNLYSKQIVENIHSDETLTKYTIFHDIGKYYVRTVDEEGKVHFPNHAEASEQIWNSVSEDKLVGKLIGMDMLIHTAKSEEIQRFLEKEEKSIMLSLLLVSLCELHSNARLFGGMENSSFKIKYKSLSRRGLQICKFYFEKRT